MYYYILHLTLRDSEVPRKSIYWQPLLSNKFFDMKCMKRKCTGKRWLINIQMPYFTSLNDIDPPEKCTWVHHTGCLLIPDSYEAICATGSAELENFEEYFVEKVKWKRGLLWAVVIWIVEHAKDFKQKLSSTMSKFLFWISKGCTAFWMRLYMIRGEWKWVIMFVWRCHFRVFSKPCWSFSI